MSMRMHRAICVMMDRLSLTAEGGALFFRFAESMRKDLKCIFVFSLAGSVLEASFGGG